MNSRAAILVIVLLSCLAGIGCRSIDPMGEAARGTTVVNETLYRVLLGDQRIDCDGVGLFEICGSLPLSGDEGEFFECSDARFLCVASFVDVFAVPRAGMRENDRYEAHRAILTVERCFGEQGRCNRALISSRCSTPDVCACRIKGGQRVVFFYFDEDRGITDFFPVQDGATALAAEVWPTLFYVLKAETGFLKREMALIEANSDVACFDTNYRADLR